jgi:hypothetical protein
MRQLIWLIIVLITIPVISQEVTQTPELSLTPTPTITLTATPTPAASSMVESTPELIATMTPSSEITLEASPEATIEMTIEPEITATLELATEILELTLEVTSEITPEVITSEATQNIVEMTPEVTQVSSETTPEMTPESSEATPEMTPESSEATPEMTQEIIAISSITPTATPGGIPLIVISGLIQYQSRSSHEDIEIHILNMQNVLLSVAQTNESGIFTVPIPAQEAFLLIADAPLHRRLEVIIEPHTILPALTLIGGDLNDDNCINQNDINLLLMAYERINSVQTDINADGITDLSDLAILTGNYDGSCQILAPEITAESDIVPIVELTFESEATPQMEITPELEEMTEANP